MPYVLSSVLTLLTGALVSADEIDFDRDVRPILKSRCVGCHGPETQEANIRLDNLPTDLVKNRRAAENWHEVLNVLDAAEMPPDDEEQLTSEERRILTSWVRGAVKHYIESNRATNGRVVQRRLNRLEYQNTMTDLLGLKMDYARDLPPDPPSEDGFHNDGRALRMSGLQLEYYLDTARRALDRIIIPGGAPKQYDYSFDECNVKGWRGNVERSNRLQRGQVFLGTMVKDYPEEGEFRIRVTFTAELRKDKGFPVLELCVGYRPDTQILFRTVDTVEITTEEEQTLEFRGFLENYPLPVRGQGKFPGLVVRVRNIYDDGSPRPKASKGKFPDEPEMPVIHVRTVQFEAPVFEEWPAPLHRRLLFASELQQTDEPAYVREVMKRFIRRAWRRTVTDSEVSRYVNFYEAIRDEFPSFEEAMTETLAMVLISPDFLYLVEPSGDEKRQVTDWELASRLSYFLWSTMPDDILLQRAQDGVLHRPEVLAEEVERMLADSRSQRFVDQFTSQWLHLDVVDRVAISKDHYGDFKEELRRDMVTQTQAFVGELIRTNASAIGLLDSNFIMLNERTAAHYSYPGIYGRSFRPVSVKDGDLRGGLLTEGSVLLANSDGTDSHAVRRAVWIRDRLLNDPPAPPPPDVPSLEEAKPEFQKLTIREQLEVHREREACAGCHRNIDPWGIALENFDAVGLWRDEVRGRKNGKGFETKPVMASDILPNGTQLSGVTGLRDYLVEKKDKQFCRALLSRLLTYAVGRRLELSDEREIDDLMTAADENNYRLGDMVRAIVQSPAFQTK